MSARGVKKLIYKYLIGDLMSSIAFKTPTCPGSGTGEFGQAGGSPSVLMRLGWDRNSLPAGTRVTVVGFQAKDGSLRASSRDLKFPDGRRLDLQVTPEAGMARSDGDFRFRLPNHDFEFNAPNFRFDGPAMRELFEEHVRREGGEPDVMVPQGRGRLGIGIQGLSPQLAEYFGTKDGVLVSSVEPDSPAGKAGLKAGDVITAIGDTEVSSPSDLTRAVHRAEDGSDLSITYMRDKKKGTATAKLETREREPRRKGEPI